VCAPGPMTRGLRIAQAPKREGATMRNEDTDGGTATQGLTPTLAKEDGRLLTRH
jgi:hypothetical protein